MKKFIIALAALSMTATPALAQRGDRHYNGYNNYERSYHHKRHHRKGPNTAETLLILGGGILIGAAISKNNRNTTVVERYEYPPVRPQTQVCYDVIAYDYYNNPYVVRRDCRYQ